MHWMRQRDLRVITFIRQLSVYMYIYYSIFYTFKLVTPLGLLSSRERTSNRALATCCYQRASHNNCLYLLHLVDCIVFFSPLQAILSTSCVHSVGY